MIERRLRSEHNVPDFIKQWKSISIEKEMAAVEDERCWLKLSQL